MRIKEKALAKLDDISQRYAEQPAVKVATDVILSVIPLPGVGVGISSLLEARASQLAEKNTRRFVEEVRTRLGRLEEDQVSRDYVESDEFTSLLLQMLRRNATAHEEEKTRLFAQIFANSMLRDKSQTPYKEGFVQIIDDLSVDHMRVLAAMSEKYAAIPQERLKEGMAYVDADQVATELGLPLSRLVAYCEHLSRFGVLHEHRPFLGYESGHYELTPYGREFAEFLRDEADQKTGPEANGEPAIRGGSDG